VPIIALQRLIRRASDGRSQRFARRLDHDWAKSTEAHGNLAAQITANAVVRRTAGDLKRSIAGSGFSAGLGE
jgi:hypothetical protein